MKVCKKCGAHYSDNKMFCIDCNERLSEKLSEEEEKSVRSNLNRRIDKLYKNAYPIRVTEFDKVIGWASLVGAVIAAVLIVVNLIASKNFYGYLYSLILLLVASAEALLPGLMWRITRLRLSFIIDASKDAEPSDFYLAARKIAMVVAAFIGMLPLIMAIF